MSTAVKFSDIVALIGLEEFTPDQISIIRELMSNAGADRGLIETYLKVDKPFTSEEAAKVLDDLIHGKVFVGGVLKPVDDVMVTTARGACESLVGQLDNANAHYNRIENAAKLAHSQRGGVSIVPGDKLVENTFISDETKDDLEELGEDTVFDDDEDEDAPVLDPEEN